MVKLTIELDESLAEAIHRLSVAQGRSETEIIQEAVAAYAQSSRPLPKGLGSYHSGQSDISENAREILRDAVRQGQWSGPALPAAR